MQEELSTTQKELSEVEGKYSVLKTASESREDQLVESEWRAHTAEEKLLQAEQESQKVKEQLQKVRNERDDLAAQVELKDKQLDWERKVGLQ